MSEDVLNKNNHEQGEKKMLKRFSEILREEKRVAVELVRLYNEDIENKNVRLLAKKFKMINEKRHKLQRDFWQMNFIEDERVQFGGGEYVLKLQENEYRSSVNKYLLTIAQALQIVDNILNK
jgi:hypothetical protein